VLQSGLGNARVAALEAGGVEGADCDVALYLQHLLRAERALGVEVTGYLPWRAPPSWLAGVRPLYRVAWAERGQGERLSAQAGSESTPHIAWPAPTGEEGEEENLFAALPAFEEQAKAPAPSRPPPRRAYLPERAGAGREAGIDPWGLRPLWRGAVAEQAILQSLREALPEAPPAPPLDLVHRGLASLLPRRPEGGDSPRALRGALMEAGPPSAESLEGLQVSFAPYPDFAEAAGLQVEALMTLDVGRVEASAQPTVTAMRHAAPGEQRWDPAAVLACIRESSGAPLPEDIAVRLGTALGHDVRHARVHTGAEADAAARAISARAFTTGSDIYFSAGTYAPGTPEGDRLLLHELTHVAQHDRGELPATGEGLSVSDPADRAEREADAVAAQVVAGGSADVSLSVGSGIFRSEVLGSATVCDPEESPFDCPPGLERQEVDRGPPPQNPRTGQIVGVWHGRIFNIDLVAGSLNEHGFSQEEALAYGKGIGFPCVLFQDETGYSVYLLETGGKYEFTEKNTRGAWWVSTRGDVFSFVTKDSVALTPAQCAAGPDVEQRADADFESGLGSGDDPMEAFKSVFGARDVDGEVVEGASIHELPEDRDLLVAFSAAMRDFALHTLALSEQELVDNRDRIDAGGPEIDYKGMKIAAGRLLDLEEEKDALLTEAGPGVPSFRGPFLLMMLLSNPPGAISGEEARALQQEVTRLDGLTRVVLADFPVLEGIDLRAFTSDETTDDARGAQLLEHIEHVQSAIDQARGDITGDPDLLWSVPTMIEATIAALSINHRRDVIDAAVAEHQSNEQAVSVLLAALSIGLGIAASLVAGPVGVALWALSVGVGVAETGMELDQYLELANLTHTDLSSDDTLATAAEISGQGWDVVFAAAGIAMDAFVALKFAKFLDEGMDITEAAAKAGIAGDIDDLRHAYGAFDEALEVREEAVKIATRERLLEKFTVDGVTDIDRLDRLLVEVGDATRLEKIVNGVADNSQIENLLAKAGSGDVGGAVRTERAIENLGPGAHATEDIEQEILHLSEFDEKVLHGETKLPTDPGVKPVGNQRAIRGGHSSDILENPNYEIMTPTRNADGSWPTNDDGTLSVKFKVKLYDDPSGVPAENVWSKPKKSTLAPESWSNHRIIAAGDEVGSTSPLATRARDSATLHQGSIDGVSWEVLKDSSGRTISSYPTGGSPSNPATFIDS